MTSRNGSLFDRADRAHRANREDCGLARRDFLRTAAGLAAVGFAPSLFARALASAQDEGRDGRVLVLVELAGGNDGLNTVVPFADDRYYQARGGIAIAADAALRLDDEVGFHPAMAPLKALFDDGKLAVVEGAGYPNPIRSHFLSMDIWHSGDLAGRRIGTGWVGRLADLEFEAAGDPNSVIALGAKLPFSCEAEQCRAIALASTKAYRVIGDGRMVGTLDSAVSSQHVSDRARKFLRDSYLEARKSSDAVAAAVEGYKPLADYPLNNTAGNDLRTVASLLAGGLKTRVFAVTMSGFDTHNNQEQRQTRLLTDLSAALAAFQQDLEKHSLADRVTVLVYSEFGRRVKANASGGTDHGAANVVFALGAGVKGGRLGMRPRLDDLDDNGDLRFTTDFRSVYATVIDRWLGGDSKAVLGERFAPLPFLA